MKKISMFIGVLSVMAIVSCKEKEETPETTTNQTIEVTAEAPAEAPVVEENPDGTSISVGKDGVDVSTKNGENKTNVNVSGGAATVEVKK